MKIIKPSVEIIREPDNMKRIEIAARVCYKSEDRIADGTAEKMCQMLIKRGHTAMLEHSNIIIPATEEGSLWELISETAGLHERTTGKPSMVRWSFKRDIGYMFSGNVRAWRELVRSSRGDIGFRDDPLFSDLPAGRVDLSRWTIGPSELSASERERHSIITARFVCAEGVSLEMFRHRIAAAAYEEAPAVCLSPAQESTRYCVAGDMKLTTTCSTSNGMTVGELYEKKQTVSNGAWKRIKVRQYNEETGELQFAKVKDVVMAGVKKCLEIETSLGYIIKATSDHKILTPHGYIQAGELARGDHIMVNGTECLYKNRDWLYHQNIGLGKTFIEISNETGFNVSTLKKWARAFGLPKKGTGYFKKGKVPWNKGLNEHDDDRVARQANALREYHHCGRRKDKILKSDTSKYQKHSGDECEFCGETINLHVHHIDKDRGDNNPENLKTVCASCHGRVHSQNLLVAIAEEVVSVKEIADPIPVYDIVMDSEHHNFVANGVVVHNCDYNNGDMQFVEPWWWNENREKLEWARLYFEGMCKLSEEAYAGIRTGECALPPQAARAVLTKAVKTEIVLTQTPERWREWLALREAPSAHPDMQICARMFREAAEGGGLM